MAEFDDVSAEVDGQIELYDGGDGARHDGAPARAPWARPVVVAGTLLALGAAAFAWWPWVLVWGVHAMARGSHGRASVRACTVAAGVGLVASVAVARTGGLASTTSPAVVAVAVAVVASVPTTVVALAVEHRVRHRRHDLHHRHVAHDGFTGRGGAPVMASEPEGAGR